MVGASLAPAPELREPLPGLKAEKTGEMFAVARDTMPKPDASTGDTPEVDASTGDTSEVDTSTGDDGTRTAQDLVAATLIQFKPPAPQPITPMPEQLSLTTPIEQAVHQLLDQIQTFAQAANDEAAPIELDDIDDDDSLEISVTPDELPDAIAVAPDAPQKPEPHVAPPKGPTAAVAVREPAPLPENPNPSHVHLVLDDGPERVVVTVAMRGNEVNVGIRGGDDQTAAAIARNAASLDHAMRARGLDLTSFTSERELGDDRREREAYQPHEREETEQFRLEEIA
ncbi:MAG: hypothetical protein HOV81_05245 [Kofleriaceae bacterium]|nr:hypothetical protein [Kofleriaceae bacterium]